MRLGCCRLPRAGTASAPTNATQSATVTNERFTSPFPFRFPGRSPGPVGGSCGGNNTRGAVTIKNLAHLSWRPSGFEQDSGTEGRGCRP